MKLLKPFLLLVVVLLIAGLSYFTYTYYIESKGKDTELSTQKTNLDNTNKELSDLKKSIAEKGQIVDANTVSGTNTSLSLLSKCSVAINIPDVNKTFEPVQGHPRFWRLGYRTMEINPTYPTDPFKGGSVYSVHLLSDYDASGYNPGLVQVQCAPNTDGFTNDTLVTKYLELIKVGNAKVAKELGETATTLVNKDNGILPMWGIPTKSVTISRFSIAESSVENGNMFVYKDMIYYVFKTSASSNKKTINSMNLIFDSLVFLTK